VSRNGRHCAADDRLHPTSLVVPMHRNVLVLSSAEHSETYCTGGWNYGGEQDSCYWLVHCRQGRSWSALSSPSVRGWRLMVILPCSMRRSRRDACYTCRLQCTSPAGPPAPHQSTFSPPFPCVPAGCIIRNETLGSSGVVNLVTQGYQCFRWCVADSDCTFYLITRSGQCM
jgi:hypothetical protein